MKIVSGKFGGRKLLVPKNKDIRPTNDKIRGAIFNRLQSRGLVENANVLDAFCGTGALGLEALSRGARVCTFNDNIRISLDLAKDNAKMLNIGDLCEFMLKDSSKTGIRPDNILPYDLVFLDPPYAKGLVPLTLQALMVGGWIASGGMIICETEKYFTYSPIAGYRLNNEKTYGQTKIILLSTDNARI